MNVKTYAQYTFTALFCLCNIFPALAQSKITKLQCEYLDSSLGIDTPNPRLSWQMTHDHNGARQTAYQLLLSTDSTALLQNKALIWDSEKTESASQLVIYEGDDLQPFTKYYWKVKIWDEENQPTEVSQISAFETGMMDMNNWQGTWISDHHDIHAEEAPYFRKTFDSDKKIQSARAYIAAAGLYELYINGQKIGNHRLDPMYTRFDRRNLYVSYDVTQQLKDGKNAMGVLLGNGWYNHQSIAVWNFDRAPWRNRPAFCLDLRITYDDGSTEVIYTDNSWKTKTGPLVFNSIYTGEHYDSRKEMAGWNTANFEDDDWQGISLRATPSKNIVSQSMQPITNVEEIVPKSIQKFNDTNYLVDMGRNFSGVTNVRLRGDSGTIVQLKHGERLYDNGHVDMSNIDVYYRPKDDSDPFQTDVVTLNGGEVAFMPKFNYKGFQYVEISSDKPIVIEREHITGYFMHSDVPAVGKIESSNPLINNIWEATNNSYLSNLFGYPTDCPQREKNGWTGDGHFAIETGLYNFDAITIYEKWLDDHRDEQQPNGVLPDIIPTGGWGYGSANGTDWTSTIAIIPWTLYKFYGDIRPLKENYESIKAYVDYVENISEEGLTTFGRGDWVPVKTSSELEYTSSVYFYVDANILAKTALLLNCEEDAQYYQTLAERIKKAINDKYFDEEKGIYASGTQTELSMALQWGIADEPHKKLLAENLAQKVKEANMHLDVGVLGARSILSALSDNGQEETAYALAVQDTYPSWGWWIVNGATTLYENWDIDAERDISLNHMMFGDIGGWFFRGLGGIKADEDQPGFKHIILEPSFVKDLDTFSASHEGPYGEIVSSWTRKGKRLLYDVRIPANSSATLNLKLKEGEQAFLDGKRIENTIAYPLTAGNYSFEIR